MKFKISRYFDGWRVELENTVIYTDTFWNALRELAWELKTQFRDYLNTVDVENKPHGPGKCGCEEDDL